MNRNELQKPPLPEALLLDHVSGAASPAMDLLMATHLAMSAESRVLLRLLENVGGTLLESLDGEPLERITPEGTLQGADYALDDVVLRAPANDDTPLARSRPAPAKFCRDLLPSPLQAYASEFQDADHWQRLGWSIAIVELSLSGQQERAHLLWGRSGARIARHRHVGREVVLVLEGAFWDGDMRYGPGDIAVGEDGSVHAPAIDQAADCLCLAVTQAPVAFVGAFGWALNRFCQF